MVRYNKELLDECLVRDDATLVGDYKRYNNEVKFNFNCKCGKEGEKCFKHIMKFGAKCRECINKNNNITIYTLETLNYCMERDDAELEEKYTEPTCQTVIKFKCKCGITGEKTFKILYNKTGAFCKKCTSSKGYIKLKNTIFERFDVSHISKSQEIKDKKKETCLKNYGVDNPMKCKEVKDKVLASMSTEDSKNKRKETCIKKYGVDNHMKAKEVKDKVKATMIERYGVENCSKTEWCKDKKKETMIERYGVEHSIQNKEVKEKIKKTNIERYGVDNVFKSKEIRDKAKATMVERYGVEYATQLQELKDKVKAKSLEKYGVENPMQNPEVSLKASKSSYKLKDYTLPNNEIIKIQGYEKFALDIILYKWKVEISDIITERNLIPSIWWIDETGNKRRYFPDIFIPSKNLIIEVKSTWTFYKKQNDTQLKLQSTRDSGYNTLLWIFNCKGDILREYNNCTFEIEDKIKNNDIRV